MFTSQVNLEKPEAVHSIGEVKENNGIETENVISSVSIVKGGKKATNGKSNAKTGKKSIQKTGRSANKRNGRSNATGAVANKKKSK